VAIANKGWKQALRDDAHLRQGLNVALGQVSYEAVANTLGYGYVPAQTLLA
jgi:alanine dehydrogenase